MKPSHDEATLAAYFQPLSPALWDDPIVGLVLRQLERPDPILLEAVADVDRSQVRDALAASPLRRLQTSWGMAAVYEESRRAPRG